MANGNGDYPSRFERMEKTLEAILEVQTLQGRNLAGILSVQQAQADRMDRADARVNLLTEKVDTMATKVDDLVGAIGSLIDHIPPQSLR